MTSDIQSKKGYLLPEQIDGYSEFVCYQVLVPAVSEYQLAFEGQIQELTRWWNWQKDGDKEEKRAARAARYWYLLTKDIVPDNCEVPLFDIRQKPDAPCIIQKTFTNGSVWVDAVNMLLCAPQVRSNNGVLEWFNPTTGLWEPLQTGDERSNGSAPIPWPDPPVGEDGACLSAENIAAYYQSVLTSIRADVVLGKSVTIIAAGVSSVLALFIPPMLFGTIALSLSAAALTLGEVGLTIMLQEEHIDNFKCVVYCNAESDGSITTSAFTAIRNGMAGWASGLELAIIEYYLDSLGSVGLQRQGAALGITTGHCDDCDCNECPYVDFVEPNYTAILGTVGSGNGISGGNALERTTGGSPDYLELEFSVNLSACPATQIELWVYIDWSSPYDRNLQYDLLDNTNTILQTGTVAVQVPERGWYERTIPVTVTLPAITHLRLRTGAEGQAGLFKVTNVAFNVV